MPITFSIFFLIAALLPGFFLFNFFKDAYDEYKQTGIFSLETLIGNPMLFFLSLAAFIVMLVVAFICLAAAL